MILQIAIFVFVAIGACCMMPSDGQPCRAFSLDVGNTWPVSLGPSRTQIWAAELAPASIAPVAVSEAFVEADVLWLCDKEGSAQLWFRRPPLDYYAGPSAVGAAAAPGGRPGLARLEPLRQ